MRIISANAAAGAICSRRSHSRLASDYKSVDECAATGRKSQHYAEDTAMPLDSRHAGRQRSASPAAADGAACDAAYAYTRYYRLARRQMLDERHRLAPVTLISAKYGNAPPIIDILQEY